MKGRINQLPNIQSPVNYLAYIKEKTMANFPLELLCKTIPTVVGETMLPYLDMKTIDGLRKVCKATRKMVDEEKCYWIRIIQLYNETTGFYSRYWKRRIFERNSCQIIKDLAFLSIEVSKSFSNSRDWTPFHLAAAYGDLNFYRKVSKLVFHARNLTRITPIHLAGYYGSNPDVFRFLLENTNEKHPVDNFNCRPLHFAAMKGHVEKCQLIFSDLGFDDSSECPNCKDMCGRTPLHLAAENGHLEVCRLFIEKIDIHNLRSRYKIEKNPNDNFRDTPTTLAQKKGHLEIVQLFEENLNQ